MDRRFSRPPPVSAVVETPCLFVYIPDGLLLASMGQKTKVHDNKPIPLHKNPYLQTSSNIQRVSSHNNAEYTALRNARPGDRKCWDEAKIKLVSYVRPHANADSSVGTQRSRSQTPLKKGTQTTTPV